MRRHALTTAAACACRVFSIDPPTAKDLDDALSVEALADGSLRVGVHIADVAHFIAPGSALDRAARERGTSTYLARPLGVSVAGVVARAVCASTRGGGGGGGHLPGGHASGGGPGGGGMMLQHARLLHKGTLQACFSQPGLLRRLYTLHTLHTHSEVFAVHLRVFSVLQVHRWRRRSSGSGAGAAVAEGGADVAQGFGAGAAGAAGDAA